MLIKVNVMNLKNAIKNGWNNLFGSGKGPKTIPSKNGKSYSYTIDVELKSELDSSKAAALIRAEQKGREYGQQDLPIPSQPQLSPYEKKEEANFNKMVQKLLERVAEPLAVIDAQLQSLREKLLYAEADETERKGLVLSAANNDSEDARGELEQSYTEESGQLKSRMKEIQNQKKILNQQLDLIPKEVRSRKQLLVFFALVALVVGGESWMNFLVFEFLLGEGRLATLLVTVAFSIAVAFGCHFLGKNLSVPLSPGAIGKKMVFWTSVVLFAVVFYVLGQFRHDYILSLNSSATTMEPWQFMVLNLLLCGVMVFASFKYTRYDEEKMTERKKLRLTIAEKEKEFGELKSRLDSLKGSHETQLAGVKAKYNRELETVHAKSDSIRNQISALETERNELQAFARSMELEIQDAYREVISEFRDVNFRYRPSKVIPAYWDEPLNLNLHFQEFTPNSFGTGGMVKLMTQASIILMCIGLFGCGQPKPEHTQAFVAIDITDSTIVEKLPTTGRFLEVTGFETKGTNSKSFECGFTVLSDVSANPIEFLSIDLTNTDENKFNRITRLQEFNESLNHLFARYGQLSKGKERSCIYRPICYLLYQLEKSKADRKVLVIFSDLLENSDIINLYEPNYVSRATFDDSWVKSRFNQKVPFPRCDGVDIIVVCQPNIQNDQLILKVQALYRSFFEEHGAQSVSFVTNL